MSIEMAVFLKRDRLPAPDEWQKALLAAGFQVRLATDFDPCQFEGFLPASYEGRDGGFEYYFSELDPSDHAPAALERVGDRDAVVSLVTHSDMTELMTSVLAAATLTHLTDGVLHDTESDEFFDADAALGWGREMEEQILPELT